MSAGRHAATDLAGASHDDLVMPIRFDLKRQRDALATSVPEHATASITRQAATEATSGDGRDEVGRLKWMPPRANALLSLMVSAVTALVQSVVAARSVAEVHDAVVQKSPGTVSNLRTSWARSNEGRCYQAVYARDVLFRTGAKVDLVVAVGVPARSEHSTSHGQRRAIFSDGHPVKASNAAEVAHLVRAFVSDNRQPLLIGHGSIDHVRPLTGRTRPPDVDASRGSPTSRFYPNCLSDRFEWNPS